MEEIIPNTHEAYEETEVIDEKLEFGQYRMKYIVTNVNPSLEENQYGYVYVTFVVIEDAVQE